MKKHISILLTLSAGFMLAGCVNNVAGVPAGEADFLAVAAASDIKITSTKISENAKATATEKVAGTVRKANYYDDGNFSIATAAKNYIGYTIHAAAGKDQFLLIDSKKKTGTIYASDSNLVAERNATKAMMEGEYNYLNDRYNDIKANYTKSASELGLVEWTVAYAVNVNVAGYNTHALSIYEEGGNHITKETNRFLTLDLINNAWVFTNYAERITITKVDEKGDTSVEYWTTDYEITVADAYSKANISLSDYTLTVDGLDASSVSYDDGCPLSSK